MERRQKGYNNLIIPTSEQARINGRKGGIARQEQYRKRKQIKEDLAIMLETVMSNGKTTQENWMMALAKNLLKGDVATANFVRDTIGEKPADKVQISGDISKVADDIGEFLNADTEANKHD